VGYPNFEEPFPLTGGNTIVQVRGPLEEDPLGGDRVNETRIFAVVSQGRRSAAGGPPDTVTAFGEAMLPREATSWELYAGVVSSDTRVELDPNDVAKATAVALRFMQSGDIEVRSWSTWVRLEPATGGARDGLLAAQLQAQAEGVTADIDGRRERAMTAG
jgi:hypothetical protein